MTRRSRLLIIAFSPLISDARVLKQIRLFTPTHEVTTCGYGPAPEGVAAHVQIPDSLVSWRLDRKLLLARRFAAAQERQEVVAWLRHHLTPGQWDVVLADDVETVPLALWLRPTGGVHADLHEYAPRQKEDVPRWRYFVAPYVRWMCRQYVRRADSVTTVAGGLAREYEREFGITAGVVINAAPYREGSVQSTGGELRLVHSGAALPDRHLDIMVEAMAEVKIPARLDLYLTPNDPGVIADLRERAARIGDDRVRVLDPVPYSALVDTLAGYDLGVFVLPPVSFNYLHALPNKLFDFIQARLGIVVSPNPDMASLVREHHLGWVSPGYTAGDLATTLNTLTPATVDSAKKASDAVAQQLSAGAQMSGWWEAIIAADRRAAAVDPEIAVPTAPAATRVEEGSCAS